MKYTLTLLTALLLAPLAGLLAAETVTVPRWQPHDFSFTTTAKTENPFTVEVSATVTGPDGKAFTLPGFCDGDGIWKLRVAPTAEGQWSLATKSDVPELNGQTATFTCVPNGNPNIHGRLRVDPEHPHHFILEDGARFFMQAYEYDWLWALDMGQPGVPTVNRTLDLIAGYGFNYVILNTYAHDTNWRKGKTGPDDYGPPPLFPWAGSNGSPDHSRMNLAYWQHYDRVMDSLWERGLQAHLFIKVYNKAVNWPVSGSAEEKLYFRWLVARYAAYPNLIWDFAKEAHNEKDRAYKQSWLKWLRENDPYHHLTTVHDDDVANDSGAYDALTDFRTDQHHGSDAIGKGKNANHTGSNHDTILTQRARRAWPVANVESDYECGPEGVKDKTYNRAMTPETTVATLWDIAMAGGYTAYYYTYTAWDVVRPLDVPKGYSYMKHFGNFWRATEFWKLDPADKLVSSGYCLAQPGREYVVFQKSPQPFTLNIVGVTEPLTGEWFNPLTGQRTAAGKFNNGTANLTPPTNWGAAPLVLHLSIGKI